jgi:hypothetical protein
LADRYLVLFVLNGESMIIIINDDEHYLRWIEENPDGFVINTTNHPSAGYLILLKI